MLLQSFGSFVVQYLELNTVAEVGEPCVSVSVCRDEGRHGTVKEQF